MKPSNGFQPVTWERINASLPIPNRSLIARLDNCGFRPTIIESFFPFGQILLLCNQKVEKIFVLSVNSINVLAKKSSNFLHQNIEKKPKGTMAQQCFFSFL